MYQLLDRSYNWYIDCYIKKLIYLSGKLRLDVANDVLQTVQLELIYHVQLLA